MSIPSSSFPSPLFIYDAIRPQNVAIAVLPKVFIQVDRPIVLHIPGGHPAPVCIRVQFQSFLTRMAHLFLSIPLPSTRLSSPCLSLSKLGVELSLFGNTMRILNNLDCVPRVQHVWRKRNTIHMDKRNIVMTDDLRFSLYL